MRLWAALIPCLLLLAPHVNQSQSFVIGEISFFGYSGLPVERVRSSLPFHEGDTVALEDVDRVKREINQSVSRSLGSSATDVAVTCCDHQGKLIIFIGLPGKSQRNFQYNPAPRGSAKLPQVMLDLYARANDLTLEAMQKQPGEDRSQGYALSAYAPLRETQISVREFATQNEPLVRRVLASAASPLHRQAAAYALGYAQQSKRQVSALVRSSRDPDEGVRNDSVRALGVLATSSRKLAAQIPVASIAAMLNSGLWTDRNKAGLLLNILTGPRNAHVLRVVRLQGFAGLVEMARWKDPDHAWDARMILGRIAGIEEKRLQQLAATGVEEIINSASSAPSSRP